MDDLERDLLAAFRFGALLAMADTYGLDAKAIKDAYMDGGLTYAMQTYAYLVTKRELGPSFASLVAAVKQEEQGL